MLKAQILLPESFLSTIMCSIAINTLGNCLRLTECTVLRKIRKPAVHSASRPRRSSLSNLTRGFYRQGNSNSGASSHEFACDLSSKLLHLAWNPTSNLIACSAGSSLFMYYA
ncbi:unnamed protein product [Linum tenue]|uniref:Uncharacterized protein n=1 Tax=Linum tenue TaxID=586396 RepID=A0AAV0IMB7_9ROSI|nr:unnamed protein product [Linum tenue]